MSTYGGSNAMTFRLDIPNRSGSLATVTHCIGEAGGNIGAVDIVRIDGERIIRDITVYTQSPEHGETIAQALRALDDMHVVNVSDRVFLVHLGGKIEMRSKLPVATRDDLSLAYTPGVARVCSAIHENPEKVHNLTIKKNTVAIVSDGSAVLGLGDIGPMAAMPVMEGKAQLFKTFGNIDAWPICLDCHSADEIVAAVKAIAPGFGGINLEDISAPRCFEIETRLKEVLDIPVFHDDQHGTAVVMTAGLINALRLVDKQFAEIRVVMAGVGAAGTACMNMLLELGVTQIIGCDRLGALYAGREHMNDAKQRFAACTNPDRVRGSLTSVIRGADVFVGISGPDLLRGEDIAAMADRPIVFAMSNPTPEISPEEAAPHVAVMATGRSDYPNQINNVLCFPGIFRGALDCQAKAISEGMKMAAARAIAACISEEELCADYIIPSVFDSRIAEVVAEAVASEARREDTARH